MAAEKKRGREDSVINARFDVYLARDICFNNPPGRNIKRYRKFTKAQKVPYRGEVLDRLNALEDGFHSKYVESGIRAVAIKLDNKIRYVWRCDVLTEAEFQIERKSSVSALRKKQQRDVGNSDG